MAGIRMLLLALGAVLASSAAQAGTSFNGANLNGLTANGIALNALSVNGVVLNGLPANGPHLDAPEDQGPPARTLAMRRLGRLGLEAPAAPR
jgi:hypothetical protein